MGEIESGVRETLSREGIKEPMTAPELQAILLAQRLDQGVEDKALAGINRELRLTLEDVKNQPKPTNDPVGALASRY